jgi:hypothetical protein
MAEPLIRTNIGQPRATIEDVYDELKAIHATLDQFLAEVRAVMEQLRDDPDDKV